MSSPFQSHQPLGTTVVALEKFLSPPEEFRIPRKWGWEGASPLDQGTLGTRRDPQKLEFAPKMSRIHLKPHPLLGFQRDPPLDFSVQHFWGGVLAGAGVEGGCGGRGKVGWSHPKIPKSQNPRVPEPGKSLQNHPAQAVAYSQNKVQEFLRHLQGWSLQTSLSPLQWFPTLFPWKNFPKYAP